MNLKTLLNQKVPNWIAVFVIILFIYTFFSIYTSNPPKYSFLKKTETSYYNFLIDSLKKFRLDIDSPYTYDLSFYNDKYYMYWGPTPALAILPFYLIGGLDTSDVIYTLVFGAINVVLFYLLLTEFVRYFKLRKDQKWTTFFVLGNFALASPNFFLSLHGRIWHTNQIVAIFYLLLFILFLFKYLNSYKTKYFVLSLFFFNLAWLARYSLFFYIILYFYPFSLLYKNRQRFNQILKIFAIFICMSFVIFFSYNFARFGRPAETGYKYQQANERFLESFRDNEMFSLKFIPHNFSVYFLVPAFLLLEKPYVWFTTEGNSIFSVYPLTLFIFLFLFKNKLGKNSRRFIFLTLIPILFNILILMMLVGTGWIQFGVRYILDAIPLLYLISVFYIKLIPKRFQILLLTYGVLINTLGVIQFYKYN